MMEGWRLENVAVYVCTTALVLGLYAMGMGGQSFWGMLLLLWVNSEREKR